MPLRIYHIDGIREDFWTNTGDEDIAHTEIFQFYLYIEPGLYPFIFGQRNLTLAENIGAQSKDTD